MEGQGVTSVRVALGGLGATPILLQGLSNLDLPAQDIAQLAAKTAHEVASESTPDLHASAAYRAHLARELTRRAVESATTSEV